MAAASTKESPALRWGAIWAMGLMISPDTLVLSGRAAGRLGTMLVAGLLAAALVHSIGAAGENPSAGRRGGRPPALLTAGRLVLTLFAVTGALVSAGYAFNEIFFHWFPNFTAAFIILAVTVGMAAVGGRTGIVWQVATTLVWGVFLAAIAAAGLLHHEAVIVAWQAPVEVSRSPGVLFALLAVLAGHDLATDPVPGNAWRRKPWVITAILLGAVLHGLWGLAALGHVSPQRLAGTTIPHLVAARAILGETGRMMMGVVIIAGAAGMSHALMDGTIRLVLQAASTKTRLSGATARRVRVASALGVGMAVAAAMAGGLAGNRLLETGLTLGLVLLLAHYAGVHWSLVCRRSGPLVAAPGRRLGAGAGAHLLGLLLLAVGIMSALWQWMPWQRT